VVISSGAALRGSPLSGRYAGAKATQRFIADYAQQESNRAGLGIAFTTVHPSITPLGGVGAPAVPAYAARAGITEQKYLSQFGTPLSPEIAGSAVVELLAAESVAPGYLLTGNGLQTMPH
jgi:hypothetical protein